MRTSLEKVEALYQWGHFRNPDFPDTHNVTPNDLPRLAEDFGTHELTRQAVASWQAYDANFGTLAATVHGRDVCPDGDIGPVTDAMFEVPRCGCPDYGKASGIHVWEEDGVAAAIGRGHWARCHGAANHHKGVGRCVGTLTPHLSAPYQGARVIDAVMAVVRRGYGEIGLEWVWDWNSRISGFQTEVRFGRWAGGWLGLAQVPSPGRSCSAAPLWAQHQNNFRSGSSPASVITWWPILLMHELGHNCSLGHSRGGIMNPSILSVPPRWVGDTSHSTMRSLFGGEPVPGWPNFDGGDTPTPGDTTWNWEQSLEFADGSAHNYQMQMQGPMMPGAGFGSFSGNFGKSGPRIGMQVLFQPRMSEANGHPLKTA